MLLIPCQEIFSSSCLQFALLRNYIVNLLRILPNPWSKHMSNYEIKWQVVVHKNCQNKMFVGQKQWVISLFWKSVSYFRIRTCFMKLSSFDIYFLHTFFYQLRVSLTIFLPIDIDIFWHCIMYNQSETYKIKKIIVKYPLTNIFKILKMLKHIFFKIWSIEQRRN